MTAAEKLDDGTVNIRGKIYKTVARRIQDFRELYPEWSVSSKILSAGDIVQVKATIRTESGRTVATGFAEEVRGSTNINKTSALENAETSAVGRALAFLGHGGTEIASADEVANAINQQKELEALEYLKRHNEAARDHIANIAAIKQALAEDNYSFAYECIREIQDEDSEGWKALWIAPSKGGIWTTHERAQMKSDEMGVARRDFHNGEEE